MPSRESARAKKNATRRAGRRNLAKAKALISKVAEAKAIADPRWADKNFRIRLIEDLLAQQHSNHEIVRLVAEQCHVAERTAYDDLKEAMARAVPESEDERISRIDRARRMWQRRIRICELQNKQADANYAADKLCKLEGVYAPKKIEFSGTVGVAIEMRAVMGILDAAGIAALELVLEQVERAKAAGKLPAPGAPA
jgi:hypothetical protein